MWPFAKKISLIESGLLDGWTDWHCHILPGVDDGIPTMEAALEALHAYAELGIREVWLTPHIMEDCPNTPDGLRSRFEELQRAWDGPVVLHLAAEHMLDALFEARFKAGALLPIGPAGDRLLVETSCYNPPIHLHALLERIQDKGFRPLLAHAERYFYMKDADYRRLREMGVEFQLNLPSLTGAYGEVVAHKARKLLKAGCYSFTGSDLHHLQSFRSALSVPVQSTLLKSLSAPSL